MLAKNVSIFSFSDPADDGRTGTVVRAKRIFLSSSKICDKAFILFAYFDRLTGKESKQNARRFVVFAVT